MRACLLYRQHVGAGLAQHLRPGRSVPASDVTGRDVIAETRQLQRGAHVPAGGIVLYVTRPGADDRRVLEEVHVYATNRRTTGRLKYHPAL